MYGAKQPTNIFLIWFLERECNTGLPDGKILSTNSISSNVKNNLQIYFANLATLYDGQSCLLGQIKSEIKRACKYNKHE
jgi:hypothetical protein